MLSFFALSFVLIISLFWLVGIVFWFYKSKLVYKQFEPSVSVIVAGRNEEKLIAACLKSLTQLKYNKDKLELVFVDDHSTDSTLQIAHEISENFGNSIKVLRAPKTQSNVGPKKNALNHGISESSGEILFFTDADNKVPQEWIYSLVKYYQDPQVGAVAGLALPDKSSRLYFLERLFVNYTSISCLGWGSPASVCGQNFSYRRKIYEELEHFPFADLPSGDDDLMAQAIHKRGWKILYGSAAESIVEDLRPPTLTAEINSAVRHQSTVKFYPWYWRLIFGLSITSYLILVILGFALINNSKLLFPILISSTVKILIDQAGIFLLQKNFKFRFDIIDLLLTQLILPIYLLIKPLLLLAPNYKWRKRDHSVSSPSYTG